MTTASCKQRGGRYRGDAALVVMLLVAIVCTLSLSSGCANRSERDRRPIWLTELLDGHRTRMGGPEREAFYDHVASLENHVTIIEEAIPGFSEEETQLLAINLVALAERNPRPEYIELCERLEASNSEIRVHTIVVYSFYDLQLIGSRYVQILADHSLPPGIREEAARMCLMKWIERSHEPLKPEILNVGETVLAEGASPLWLKVRVLALMRVVGVLGSRSCLERLELLLAAHPDDAEQVGGLIRQVQGLCECEDSLSSSSSRKLGN